MIQIQLSMKEIKLLAGLRTQTNDERSERALMILLSNDGLSALQIATQLKRNTHSVRLWLNRYIEEGINGLYRKYSQGAPSTKRDLLIKSFNEWFSKSPMDFGYQSNAWTISLMIDSFKKKTQEIVSKDTVQRALKKAGYSYKKPKKTVPSRAPSKEAKKHRVLEMITEIKAFIEDDEANIYFLDETHFSTQPYIVKGWQKKGKPFLIPKPLKWESCTIFGAWNLKEKSLFGRVQKKVTKIPLFHFYIK